MRILSCVILLICAAAAARGAQPSLLLEDMEGTWRLSAVASAKYGCDIPGAITVEFKTNAQGGLTGTYVAPGMPGVSIQRFVPVATMGTVLNERGATGRAITLDSPAAMRRILAVETAKGADGRPARLEWASQFGGFGEDASVFDQFVPSGWLTRC